MEFTNSSFYIVCVALLHLFCFVLLFLFGCSERKTFWILIDFLARKFLATQPRSARCDVWRKCIYLSSMMLKKVLNANNSAEEEYNIHISIWLVCGVMRFSWMASQAANAIWWSFVLFYVPILLYVPTLYNIHDLMNITERNTYMNMYMTGIAVK